MCVILGPLRGRVLGVLLYIYVYVCVCTYNCIYIRVCMCVFNRESVYIFWYAYVFQIGATCVVDCVDDYSVFRGDLNNMLARH